MRKVLQSDEVPLLTVGGLFVRFGKRTILHDINFNIASGEIVAVLGPNGAGKSTLMKAILGLIPFDGSVKFYDRPVEEMYGRIGYVPQRFDVDDAFPITVNEFLELALVKGSDKSRIIESLHEVRLDADVIGSSALSNLSGGQLQRVLIARAILSKPDILFLDEPSQGIDVAGAAMFVDIIQHLNKYHGTTIFMISHEIDVVEQFVTRIICLNKQLICSGHPSTVMTDDAIRRLYGEGYIRHKHHH